MIPIEHIQFAAIILTGMLTLMLVIVLPRWSTGDKVFRRSHWLIALGTMLIPIQFLLQYIVHFRQMGITQAVMVNLLFFIPSAWLINMSVLYLLRRGQVKRHEGIIGLVAYAIAVVLIVGANMTDGQPLLTDTPELRRAELISAVLYMLSQAYHTWLEWRELRRVSNAMDAYYDHEKHDVIRWMRTSVIMLTLSGLFVPWAIFWSNTLLTAYSMLIFFTISYCVISFYSYGIDHRRQTVLQEAEKYAEESQNNKEPMNDNDLQRVQQAVNNWIAKGGHLRSGITVPIAATEMHIPRYLLTLWLKGTEWELFSPWLAHLRIEEAKRLLAKHPDWSNDVVADHCGFGSRSYFQTVFRKNTGMTPAQYIACCRKDKREG